MPKIGNLFLGLFTFVAPVVARRQGVYDPRLIYPCPTGTVTVVLIFDAAVGARHPREQSFTLLIKYWTPTDASFSVYTYGHFGCQMLHVRIDRGLGLDLMAEFGAWVILQAKGMFHHRCDAAQVPNF